MRNYPDKLLWCQNNVSSGLRENSILTNFGNIYLHWDSHHSITNKYSVYNTLSHRAQNVCSNQQLLKRKNQHIQTALCRCNYPEWVFHTLWAKLEFQLSQNQWHNNRNLHRINNRNHNFIVVPYSKGFSESFRSMYQSRSPGSFQRSQQR